MWTLPLPMNDFIVYWVSGHLFMKGADPYSASAFLQLERSIGWTDPQTMLFLNPPWVLPFSALLAALPFAIARVAWLIASVGLEAVSAVALWRYFGGQAKHSWVALLILAGLVPSMSAEHMGQITPLILAGITALLYCIKSERHVLAGACMLVLGLKPHLLYLFILALALVAIQKRLVGFIASTVLTFAATTLATFWFDPLSVDYLHRSAGVALGTPCGIGALSSLLFGHHRLLQFLPTCAGLGWFMYYWNKHKQQWVWQERTPALLLVSIGTSPYFWAHDFILALPALIALAAQLVAASDDFLVPSACYLLLQLGIFASGSLSPAWMPAMSAALWIPFYYLESRQLHKSCGGDIGYCYSGG